MHRLFLCFFSSPTYSQLQVLIDVGLKGVVSPAFHIHLYALSSLMNDLKKKKDRSTPK
jgi:hypothetical protein